MVKKKNMIKINIYNQKSKYSNTNTLRFICRLHDAGIITRIQNPRNLVCMSVFENKKLSVFSSSLSSYKTRDKIKQQVFNNNSWGIPYVNNTTLRYEYKEKMTSPASQ